ncbi:TPA: hypothetical protein KEY68_000238 [Providencia rettgeri]|nr:hypothetical protein [Providencia rettgeri]EJF7713731.1 hypothetical protein [Providencia rettgeri]ELR5117595.1 hypothetical protein [Providencia rettgeri]EMB5784745.1 hypothetical protein [Providencia rettgeri]MBI6200475.1 hypothetical protein [Providencia rettgeri]
MTMKRLLLAFCLAPALVMADNAPLNISEIAKDYCEITGQALSEAYSTDKTSSELTQSTIAKLKSENVDLKQLATVESDLRENLTSAIDAVRSNKSKFANEADFNKSLNDSISACKIQTELLLNKS